MKTLTKQDLEDYIIGAVILGTGGGGSGARGKDLVKHAFEKGLEFKLADLDEFDDEDMLCIISGVGGGVPEEARKKVEPYAHLRDTDPEARFRHSLKSIEELEKYIGKKFASFVPSETGGGNGVMPMYLNALVGNPSVDGDSAGRAKPEIGISLTHVAGIPMAPISMLTPFKEVVIAKSVIDDYRGEDITRHVAVASGGGVTATRSSGTVKQFKNGIARNQVSRCIKIGAAIREAREAGEDPKDAFLEASGGVKVFEGTCTGYDAEGKGGFNWGHWYIKGEGDYEGHELKVWYKNENLVSWLDGEQFIVCPDLICIVDTETCEGHSNFRSADNKGKKVTVFGVRAIDLWRTPKGIEVFGPRHFGFDLDYVPMEKVI